MLFHDGKKDSWGAQVGGKLHLSRTKLVALEQAGEISLCENKENIFRRYLKRFYFYRLVKQEFIKNLNETRNFPPFSLLQKLKLYFLPSLSVAAEIFVRISIFLFLFFLILPKKARNVFEIGRKEKRFHHACFFVLWCGASNLRTKKIEMIH